MRKRRLFENITFSWLLAFLVLITVNQVFAQENTDKPKRKMSWSAFPALASQPETGFQFGASGGFTWSDPDTTKTFSRPSSLTPFFLYTVRNQIISGLTLDYFFLDGKNLGLSPRFRLFPDKFFGIGNDTDPDISEGYTHLFFQLEGQYSFPLNDKLFYGAYFDIQQSNLRELEAGGILETNVLEGSNGGFQAGIGPAVRLDSRDNTIYPTQGYFINLRTLFNYVGDFSYSNLTIDARRYIGWNEGKDVLAIQAFGSFNAGRIPFYKLPQLGGDAALRGISNASVYRDNQMMYSQVEYRRYLFWIVGAVAYLGAGDVAENLEDFRLGEFKYAGGVGLRFQVVRDERLNIRFDYGLARRNQSAFYVSILEAF
ncbi:MAG: BamA/TamA family outer membrane protein [Cytophagales bacterium]|nr:BamA/TamA family outer membrane protein [Cytophagales bacterium]